MSGRRAKALRKGFQQQAGRPPMRTEYREIKGVTEGVTVRQRSEWRRLKRAHLLTLASMLLLWLLPSLAAAECKVEPAKADQDPKLSILAGGLASLSADASGVAPLARVGVSWPVYRCAPAKGPEVFAQVDLTALPGDTLELTDAKTFKAVEVEIGIEQPLGTKIAARLAALGGFATRLATDRATPRDRAPRFGSFGLAFRSAGGDRLFVGIGGDQRLSGDWEAAVLVEGAVRLKTVKGEGMFAGGSLSLVGSAILGLDYGPRPAGGRRDAVRVGIAVGKL